MPFTINEFLDVFRDYNRSIYPFQFFLVLSAAAAIYFSIRSSANSSRIVSAILALLWVWSGAVYHILFFSRINAPAYLFGALFVLQAGILLYAGAWKGSLKFRVASDGYGAAGGVILLYALTVYPVVVWLSGHVYPAVPTFGAPCPVVIFTLGILFWTERGALPRYIMIVPIIWSLIGTSAAVFLEMTADVGLLISAFAASTLLFRTKFTAEPGGQQRQENHV